METSVCESWCVIDYYARESPCKVSSLSSAVYLCRKHLLYGLDGIVESVKAGCLHFNAFACHLERISLSRHCLIENEAESVAAVDSALSACHERKLLCELLDDSHRPFVEALADCKSGAFYIKVSVLDLNLVRIRYDIDCLYIFWRTSGCCNEYRQDDKGIFHVIIVF